MTAESDHAATKNFADESRTRGADELVRAVATTYEILRRRLRPAGRCGGKSGDTRCVERQIRAAADRYESDVRAAGERYDAAMSRILAGEQREPGGEREYGPVTEREPTS